jgi:N-hydroxyarylamine O-acetyltransferase
MSSMIPASLLEGYLRRIGLDRIDNPSLENLFTLQASHLDNLSYSNLDLLLGRPEGLEPLNCIRHIVEVGRSSGCCQHNGAFAAVLQSLGYKVRSLWGTVSSEPGKPGTPAGNHMAINVTVQGEDWLTDVGLGDAFRAPIRLQSAIVEQYPFRYELRQTTQGSWLFRHDPRGSFAEVEILTRLVEPQDFTLQYTYYISDPESPFLRTLAIHRRGHDFVSTLRGRTLRRIDKDGVHDSEVQSEEDLWSIIVEVFKISIGDVTPLERHQIWRRISTHHSSNIETPPEVDLGSAR